MSHGHPATPASLGFVAFACIACLHPNPLCTSFTLLQAIAQQPMALTIISDGPLVDVEVDVHEEQQQQPAPAPVPSSTCTGIVHVPNSNSAEADVGAAVGEGGSR